MPGRLINGERYIYLMNDNSFKSMSLEDNVYFTLRDIFLNGCPDDCLTANYFNGILTNDISFGKRDENFKYSNVLNDCNCDFAEKLYTKLRMLCGYKFEYYYPKSKYPMYNKYSMFDFEEEDDEIDMSEYMKFDDWWEQLLELMKKLEEQVEKLKEDKKING
jgi:hypothetical protein